MIFRLLEEVTDGGVITNGDKNETSLEKEKSTPEGKDMGDSPNKKENEIDSIPKKKGIKAEFIKS